MKGRTIPYSAVELAWIEEHRQLPVGELLCAFDRTFGRPDVRAAHLTSLRKRKGWTTGRTGRFEKGAAPANKGKAMPYNANSAATRFKKGERRGVAVRLYKPIGTERLSKDGYLERKVHDGLPLQSRWKGVHRLRWEETNGPVPAGHALKCLDGNRLNTDPTNWRAVPCGMLPRLNGGRNKTRLAFDGAAPELKPTIMAIAEVEQAVQDARSRGRS